MECTLITQVAGWPHAYNEASSILKLAPSFHLKAITVCHMLSVS